MLLYPTHAPTPPFPLALSFRLSNFSDTNLSGVSLFGVLATGTNFTGADLTNAGKRTEDVSVIWACVGAL